MKEIELSVPVTKSLKDAQAQSIIEDYVRQRMTFGVKREADGRVVVWRRPVVGDFPIKNKTDEARGCVIQTQFPDIKAFEKVWLNGAPLNGKKGRS